MAQNLNEKYLLKFLSRKEKHSFCNDSDICKLLKKFNLKIEFKNYKPVYDIIESYEEV